MNFYTLLNFSSIDFYPIFLSIKVAFASLLLVIIFGITSARLLHNKNFAGQAALEAFFSLPLVLPPVVTGFLLLLLIGRYGPIGKFTTNVLHTQLVFTPYAAIIAGAIVAFPLMYQSAKSAFASVDSNLEDAARTLGASELKVFFTITIPLAWPGLLSGIVMSFARALGEFGATIMVAGNIPGKTQTIPLAIYFAAESNDLTVAGFYVIVISLLTFSLIWSINHISNRRRQR